MKITFVLFCYEISRIKISRKHISLTFFLDGSKHTHAPTEVEEVSSLNNRQPINPLDHGNRYRAIFSPCPARRSTHELGCRLPFPPQIEPRQPGILSTGPPGCYRPLSYKGIANFRRLCMRRLEPWQTLCTPEPLPTHHNTLDDSKSDPFTKTYQPQMILSLTHSSFLLNEFSYLICQCKHN